MAPPADLHLDAPCRKLLGELAAFFEARSVEAYATGGFLRDALARIPIHDIDLSVRADPLVLGRELADGFAGHYFALDEERQRARVLIPDREIHIDLMLLDGDIEADLRARDYTIDALAAPLHEVASGRAQLIDPTGGLADLRAGLVRATSEDALREDPLRLLRGPRIATQLGFRIEPGSHELIRRNASLINEAAVERQRDEVMRIFGTQRASAGLRLLEELGLFAQVFPEMEVTRDVEQPKEHYHDVLGHSIAAVEALDYLMVDRQPRAEPWRTLWADLWPPLDWCEGLRDYFAEEVVMGTRRLALLKLCALLHDIGKPETKSFQEDGRMRFFGHGDAGARIAVGLMRRMHFSAREIAIVKPMIEAHLRPIQMAQQGAPSRRAVYRFFRDTGEAGIDTLFLSLGDHLGTVGPRVSFEGFRAHAALTGHILRMRFQEQAIVSPPRLLRGDELMAALGLAPGPLVGELLEAVREAQAAGEVSTRQEALALARGLLAERTPAA